MKYGYSFDEVHFVECRSPPFWNEYQPAGRARSLLPIRLTNLLERDRSQVDRNHSLRRPSIVAAIARSRSVIRGAAKSMKARNLSGSSRSRA